MSALTDSIANMNSNTNFELESLCMKIFSDDSEPAISCLPAFGINARILFYQRIPVEFIPFSNNFQYRIACEQKCQECLRQFTVHCVSPMNRNRCSLWFRILVLAYHAWQNPRIVTNTINAYKRNARIQQQTPDN